MLVGCKICKTGYDYSYTFGSNDEKACFKYRGVNHQLSSADKQCSSEEKLPLPLSTVENAKFAKLIENEFMKEVTNQQESSGVALDIKLKVDYNIVYNNFTTQYIKRSNGQEVSVDIIEKQLNKMQANGPGDFVLIMGSPNKSWQTNPPTSKAAVFCQQVCLPTIATTVRTTLDTTKDTTTTEEITTNTFVTTQKMINETLVKINVELYMNRVWHRLNNFNSTLEKKMSKFRIVNVLNANSSLGVDLCFHTKFSFVELFQQKSISMKIYFHVFTT